MNTEPSNLQEYVTLAIGHAEKRCANCCSMVSTLKQALDRFPSARHLIQGTWPENCVQRAFVDGAKWARYVITGFTAFRSEEEEAEEEAVKRYGEPTPDDSQSIHQMDIANNAAFAEENTRLREALEKILNEPKLTISWARNLARAALGKQK